MPKAYLYNRVSSDQQVKFGEGLKRQEESAIKFLSQYPEYEIADTITDSGVSAFKGHNSEDGGLGRFIAEAKAGNIEPDSILVIEAPDRLTRLGIKKGQRLFDEIMDCKINIAMVRFGTILRWDDDNDFTGSLIVSIGLYLGHLESQQKSERIRASKLMRQKQAVESGRIITTSAPKWLNVVGEMDNRKFEPIDNRVQIVNEIFDLYIDGYGFSKIANLLNNRGEPSWGDRGNLWQKSYIMNMIKDRVVLGAFQPKTTEKKTVKGNKSARANNLAFKSHKYYPQVVSTEKWEKARVIWLQSSTGKGTNTGKGFKNLFTQGLAVCGCCGKNMNYLSKGRGYNYLVCPSNLGKNNRCSTRNIPYKKAETIMLAAAEGINYTDIFAGESCRSHRKELCLVEARLREDIKEKTNIINNYKTFISEGNFSKEIASSIIEAESQREELKEELISVNYQIGEMSNIANNAEDIGSDFRVLYSVMSTMDDIDKLEVLRNRLHRQLKSVFDEISISFNDGWLVTFHFKNSELTHQIKMGSIKLNDYRWFDITNDMPMHPITRGVNTTPKFEHEYGTEAFESHNLEMEMKNL